MLKKKLLFFLTVILTVVFVLKAFNLLDQGLPYIRGLLQVQGDYDRWNRSKPLTVIALEAKKNIPTGACVESSFPKAGPIPTSVFFRYQLFELKIKDNWLYAFNSTQNACNGRFFIDLDQSFRGPFKREIALAAGAKIFVLEEPSSRTLVPQGSASAIRVLAVFLMFNGLTLITGIFIFFGFFPKNIGMGLWGVLSTSFLLGFAGITMLFWMMSLLGISLSQPLIVSVLLAFLVSGYFFMKLQGGQISIVHKVSKSSLTEMVLSIGIVAVLFFFVLYTISFPICIWDEVYIWLLKAKMFFVQRGLIFDYTEYTNNYYPVIWPLNLALQYILADGHYDQMAKWTSGLFFLCLAGQLNLIARSLRLSRRDSMLVVLIFLVGFNHWTFFTALPENIHIAFTAMVIAFFIAWLDKKNSTCKVIALIALLTVSGIKFEGFLTGIFIFVAYVLSAPDFNKMRKDLAGAMPFLTTILVYGGWLAWVSFNQIPFKIFHLHGAPSLANFAALFKMVASFMRADPGIFIIVLVAFTVPFVTGVQRPWSRGEKALLIFCSCLIVFDLTAGICWPHREFVTYYPEVLTRLFSRTTLFLLVLWMSRTFGKSERSGHFE